MFIRSIRHPFGTLMSRAWARRLTLALYVLYPIGCLLQLYPSSQPQGLAWHILGLLMVAAAFTAFAVLAGSSFQRQAQEPESLLDERERSERNRAAYLAHSIFAGVVLLGVIYIMLSIDLAANDKATLWVPQTGSHWNAIFWGLTLAALTLPAAVLAWSKAPTGADEPSSVVMN